MSYLPQQLYPAIEDLFRESVVLIMIDEKPVATGFVVSESGDVCSCHHYLDPHNTTISVSARLGNEQLLLDYDAEISRPEHDFAMFHIDERLLHKKTAPVPLLDISLSSHQSADTLVALGFPAMEDPFAPLRMRVVDGHSLGIVEYRHSSGRMVRTLEVVDLAVGKGMSGGPVFDLREFRVVAYIQGKLLDEDLLAKNVSGNSPSVERLGRACLLDNLLRSRSDLRNEWRAAGLLADRKKQQIFNIRGMAIPCELLTRRDAKTLIQQNNQAVIDSLQQAGIFNDQLFVPRPVEKKIHRFLQEPEYSAAIVSGASGTGKTNLLANFVLQHQRQDDLFVLVQGNTAGDNAEPLGSICPMLGVAGELQTFVRFVGEDGQKLTIVLDAFNEWQHASKASFLRLLKAWKEISQGHAGTLKLILSIRTEFLREQAPELLTDPIRVQSTDPLNIIFQYSEGQEVGREQVLSTIDLPILHPSQENGTSEQEILYEHYRKQQKISDLAGRLIGIRPNTAYRDLPANVRTFLDRPLLLKLFMVRYDGCDVPESPIRYLLLKEITSPDTTRWAASSSIWERAEIFMIRLADVLSRTREPAISTLRLADEQLDLEVFTQLLEHTFFLAKSRLQPSTISGVSFSSDWLLEYYLSLFFCAKCLEHQDLSTRVKFLNEHMLLSGRHLKSNIFSGALAYFAEWALSSDHHCFAALLQLLSLENKSTSRQMLLSTVFEYIRLNFGFDKSIPKTEKHGAESFRDILTSLSSDLGTYGIHRLLHYLEFLQNEGSRETLLLLCHKPMWAGLDRNAMTMLLSIRALKYLECHEIELAMKDLAEIGPTIPDQVHPRWAFVMGRCLQFRGQYREARVVFEQCLSVDNPYSSRCRHQIAFIRYFHESDYPAAAQMLKQAYLASNHRWTNSSSKLLYTGCLSEMGLYDEAESLLAEEVEIRRKAKQRLGYGRALRNQAQLYIWRFEAVKAFDAINAALEATRNLPYYLTYAGILDLKATAAVLLGGDFGASFQCADESIRLNRRAAHNAGISWAFQTRALLFAACGNVAAMEEDLGSMISRSQNFSISPNQVRRTKFIRLFGDYCARLSSLETLLARAIELKKEYQEAKGMWYQGVLSLLILALQGAVPVTPESAAACFGGGISLEGLCKSHIFALIFGQVQTGSSAASLS
ncbi:MAG: hypothetical protein DMG65_09230 [Candidatus Angelobacter sp. Gp1-AA117]|nr:MAG: hypothetical protein DMG65_09230 [Candidatus Angelobacter sp. Gp1-AA117]